MIPSEKQIAYIIYTLKSNKWQFDELEQMFPPKIEDEVDISLSDLENKIKKLERLQVSDIISLLKDDNILEGFEQLNYLIKQ